MSTLLILGLGLFFISGAPLFTIMLAATALGALFSARGFEVGFDGAINKLFGTSGRDEMEVLSTIPLFIYVGYLLAEAKTADRLVRAANAALGWIPGGLAIVTIFTCAVFTVFTGASGVTIIALGGVLMPALVKNGYPERFSLGLIAGTGSVGLLLPPALPLFIYGTVYGLVQSEEEKAAGVWATDRFLFAGVLPGLFLIGLLCAVAVFVAVKKKLPRQKFDIGELGRSLVIALPEMFIPIGVVAALGLGIGSLSEVAALTLVYVLILEIAVFKTITPKIMWRISHEAMAMVGAIFMIILASTALTDFMVNAEVPRKMVEWTTANVGSKIVFLLAINIILLIVGTVMDIFSAIVVVVPLIAPIARQYGIDPYHLGVIFLLNLEVGYLHPPVGLNLFLTSVKFQRPITEVMWATVPFLITMIVALFIITYVPTITTSSVPPAEKKDPVMNLVAIMRAGKEESRVAAKDRELALVDAIGNQLRDAKNTPIVHKMSTCREPIPQEGGKTKLPSDSQVRECQKIHMDVTECASEKTPDEVTSCRNKAIAKWTANWFKDNPEIAVITVKSVALVDDSGEPLEFEREQVGPDGNPVLNALGEPEKESVKIADNEGKPLTRTLDWCDKLKFPTDVGKCKQLFVGASNCKIDLPTTDECLEEKCKAPETPAPAPAPGAGSGSGSAAGSGSPAGAGTGVNGTGGKDAVPFDAEVCKKAERSSCLEKAINKCITQAVKDWVDENQGIASAPKLK